MIKYIITTIVLSLFAVFGNSLAQPNISFIKNNYYSSQNVVQEQIRFDCNNIDTWIQNTGIFNSDIRTSNTPGAMWPKGSNRFSIFSSGLSIGTYIEGQLKMATASYKGEYAPSYVQYIDLVPIAVSTPDFKLYKVTSSDSTSADYINWYKMVPFGAPYFDRNNNGVFDQGIDRPGIKNATQTIFVCMTDGFPENHTSGEGFSGGTTPLFSEMHLTAWGYNKEGLKDIQFLSFVIINKNTKSWNNTFLGIVADPDIGDATDDYIGCDTVLNLGYCYNSDNMDGNGYPPTYGANPPATGMRYLFSPLVQTGNQNDSVVFYEPPGSNNRRVKKGYRQLGMSSFVYYRNASSGGIACETQPTQPIEAFRYLNGVKKDGSPWFNAGTKQRTKKLFPGNPETGSGWTEYGYNGNPNIALIKYCAGGDSTATFLSPPGERRFILGTGNANLTINPNDTQRIILAQIITGGSNNKNAVSVLKNLSTTALMLLNSNFAVPVINLSSNVPDIFSLSQNFPNPFNPNTNIKFAIPKSSNVKISVYDISGKELEVIVNERLQAGTYQTEWNGSNYSSGIYFYKIQSDGYTETKRMTLIK